MEPITTKARRFPPGEAISYVRQINDSAFEDNCVLKPSLLSQRKRACSEQHPGQQSVALPPTKRRKDHHSSELPANSYDNLSQKHLTKGALRELNKRNTQAVQSAYRTTQKQSSGTSEQERANYLRSPDPKTLEACKKISRHGGLDMSDLRSFPEPTNITKRTITAGRSSTLSQQRDPASASTRPTTITTKTKTVGTYERRFEQHLLDHHIYPNGNRHLDGSRPAKPNNWEDLHHILTQRRPSLSSSRFSDQEFEKFRDAVADAKKEKDVSELVLPIIEDTIEDRRCRSGGIPFNNLDPLTDGTLKPGNPDVYYGALPHQLSREVRNELSGHIIPSTQEDLPMAPNFLLAVKGPGGSFEVAKRQACYDGALGARGMASLQSYGQGEPNYGTAYAISSIYDGGGTLAIYTSHMTQPSSPGGRPSYHQTQLRAFAMTDTVDTFRQGAGAYRNLRDWAKRQRDDLIRHANERYANEKAVPAEVETSAKDDEVSASPALSCVTAASDTEAYTMKQEPQTTLNQGSNMLGIIEEFDSSMKTRAGTRVAARQPNKRKRRSTNAQSKASKR
ncbi:hypothetical protein N0V90_012845 [Kalmusia sp. IMI 367209]|nr:hypothetical protein N0V90_012845 [Kalmusia sp. IMI 367209]